MSQQSLPENMPPQASAATQKQQSTRRRSIFTKKKPVAKKANYAFIDSQNLNLGIQKMGWKLDWRKFREYLRTEHGVENAYLFIGYLPENEQLYLQMHDLGYLIVLKPTLEAFMDPAKDKASAAISPEIAQSEGAPNVPSERKNPVKGNIDAELVLYAMKEMPHYEKAIIVSGDGDFYCLIEYLAEQNKLLTVLAPNRFYSTLLKPFEQFVLRLDTMRTALAYKNHRVGVRTAGGHAKSSQKSAAASKKHNHASSQTKKG